MKTKLFFEIIFYVIFDTKLLTDVIVSVLLQLFYCSVNFSL